MKKVTIKKLLLFSLWGLVGLFFSFATYAQHTHADGTTHEDHEAAPAADEIKMKKSEAVSERYELVLKYEHLHAGEDGKLMLYVADPVTNRAVSGAKITLSTSLDSKATFAIKPEEAGVYEITSKFTKERTFALTAKIEGANGPDIMMLKGVLVGHDESEHAHEETEAGGIALYGWQFWGLLFIGILLGVLLTFFVMRSRNRTLFVLLIVVFSQLPTANWRTIQAQHVHADGSTHGDEGTKSTVNLSNEVEVPKETQFLFDVLTEKIEKGNFKATTQLYGTVIPSSAGMAVVQTPQIGRIVSLNARVGQRVGKGQTLAVLEQNIDATTQANLQAERNSLEAELTVAQKNYDRLKKIEDIAAKREVSEAEARLSKAQENLKIFNNIAQKGKNNSRLIALTAPISGIVSPFSVAIGSTVGTSETLFTITNLNKVYVEAQVFEQDVEQVQAGTSFEVECQRGTQKHLNKGIRLLSTAQMVNANQSQKVLFEVDNLDGVFKIGGYVTMRVGTKQNTQVLALPNAALNQINGKPCVFIKEAPERFRIEYVAVGQNNGEFTTILDGLHAGEKVVVTSAYQLKMIFLNQ